MKKELVSIITALVFILIFSNLVLSIGLAPSKKQLSVQPNNKYVVQYQVMGAPNFEVEIGSHPLLKQYITTTKIKTNSRGDKVFDLILDFPSDIEKQGHESINIIVKEKPAHSTRKGRAVTGLTVVEGMINIDIPYEGLYAEMFTEVHNANHGEEVEFDITMQNFGQVEIKESYVTIEIFKDDKKIKTLESEKTNIPIGSAHEFIIYLDTNELKPGIYSTKITGYYDSKKRQVETTFKIGSLDILITDFTKEFYVNETNEFLIQIESLWNSHIEKVFADLTISKDNQIKKQIQTPTYDLRPWDSQQIITYLETQNWELGEYDLEIKLHFEDTSKIAKDKIYIIQRPEPEKPFDLFGFNTTALSLIGITIIMVVLNIILLTNIFKNRNTKKGKNNYKKKK